MADQKLSVLTELAVEPADTDEVYINDGGTSKRITYGTLKTALLARANHTGTQLASTISDFASAVAATSEVTANTAKLSADDPALISALAEVTAEGTDYAVILDTSVSPNALKKILISDLLDNASHSGDVTGSAALTAQPAIITGKGAVTVDAADLLLVTDVSASPQVLGQVTAQSVADLRQLTADDVIGEGPGAVDGADVLLTVDVSASPQILARTTAASVASLATPEGTAILSTGEVGGTKFLREDGDGTCSWQTVVAGTGDFMADGSVPMTGNLTFAAASPELTVDGRNVSADGAKLDGIEAGATADQTANEILTALLTVDGTASLLDADLLDGNEATAFATAAQANATHSGDATGDTALTLQPAAITGKGAVTVDGADLLLVTDVSASPQVLGQVTAQSIANLAPAVQGSAILSSDTSPLVTDGYVLTATGTGTAAWEPAAAGAGDFKADGTVDMTGEFRTDVGTFDSDVADGASAVAFSYDTAVAYSTSGAKLAVWNNNGAEKFYIDKDGSINQAGSYLYGYSGGTQVLRLESGAQLTVSIGSGASATSSKAIAVGYLASGTLGGIALGWSSSATQNGIAMGYLASQTGLLAIAMGRESVASHYRDFALAGEKFASAGDHQFHIWQPAATTTDATPAALYLDEDGAANRMSIASGKMYAFTAHIVGVQSDGTDACYYVRRGIIANNGGTTALIGTVQTDGTDIESNAACDVSVTANNTTDNLDITVTGIAAETWRWSANVFVKDITIGT